VGIENTATAIQALGDQIHEGVHSLGFETQGRRTPETGAGIVSFRKPGIESQAIVRKLKEANIVTAPRQGWVRAAPHFYIAPEEIDRMLSELKAF
jgi:selenocysteine lyase/cysteine desulfurase